MSEIDQLFEHFRPGRFLADAGGGQAPIPQQQSPGGNNIQPPGWLAPGTIGDLTYFADTIRPVAVVTALPALPDANYPINSYAVLTTDNRLYENVGNVWVNAVSASLPADTTWVVSVTALPTLPSSSYPQGSVVYLTTDKKLYRTDGSTWIKAVDGGDITAGTVTANAILAGTITTSQIAAATILGSNIAANTIAAGNIVANTITAAQIAAGAIGAAQIAAGAITTPKLAAGAVTADKLLVGSHNGSPITNPDWEQGLTGWTTSVDGINSIGVTGPGATAASGSYYLAMISNNSGTVDPMVFSNQFPVGAGQAVKVSVAIGGNGGFNRLIYVAFLDVNGAVLQNYIVFQAPYTGGTWPRVGGTAIAPANTVAARVHLVHNIHATGGVLQSYWDDLRVSVEEDHVAAAGSVTIDSAGVTIINGKLTVKNPTGTVIIDGTSDMFKILMSGTQYSGTIANGTSGNVSTFAGVQSWQTSTLAVLGGLYRGTGTYNALSDANLLDFDLNFNYWAASSNGGPTAFEFIGILAKSAFYGHTSGTAPNCNPAAVSDLYNLSGSGEIVYCRFYILREASL